MNIATKHLESFCWAGVEIPTSSLMFHIQTCALTLSSLFFSLRTLEQYMQQYKLWILLHVTLAVNSVFSQTSATVLSTTTPAGRFLTPPLCSWLKYLDVLNRFREIWKFVAFTEWILLTLMIPLEYRMASPWGLHLCFSVKCVSNNWVDYYVFWYTQDEL